MKTQLLDRGLGDSVLRWGRASTIEGERDGTLCHDSGRIWKKPLIALERRGISLRIHAERQDLETGKLPVFHVFLGRAGTLVLHARESGRSSCRSRKRLRGERIAVRMTATIRIGARTDDGAGRAGRIATAHYRIARSSHDQSGPGGFGRVGIRHPVPDPTGTDGHRGSALCFPAVRT